MSQNVWKTTFTLFVIFQITYAWELVCYNGTLSNFKRVSYENAADLITSGYYDINKSGVFYAYGYRGTTTTEGTDVITEALLERMGINVCVVDWATEANLGLIPLANFPLVIAASDVVQAQLAQALKIMRDNGLDPKLVQLFGFSLGAHLIGNAGRTFSQLTNMTVARATGVDPAKPGFDGPIPLNKRIDKTCADFVDIIHTDTNRYGMATAVGHVDCYPNIITYKKDGVQPKCPPVNLLVNGALTPEDACSHRFSLNLYIDSLRYKCQLLAAKAANETEWASPDFVPTVIACIGVDIDTTLNGTFYMVTAGQYPYGLNETGLKSS